MWMCKGCGLSLEVRKVRQRKVMVPYMPPVEPLLASRTRHPSSRPKVLAEPVPRVQPAPEQTVACPGCDKGRIGVARWAAGIHSCTSCEPLRMVAVQPNKAAEVFDLELSPEQAASVRRRS
jgi:hypothetical protein